MEFQLSEYAKHIEELEQRSEIALRAVGKNLILDTKDDSIRLVFAGQYSAGKSSIIKMLTDIKDIVIGPGITTEEVKDYEWRGLCIVDTPGIHTVLRPDHDEKSYKEIASADMLVFVITANMFDSDLAEHFRELAIEKDKAGEMILVVNKMNGTAGGNTIEQQNIIREDLRQVLAPYTPEQLYLCFLDAKSYLESLSESDPEIKEILIERSGYDNFINTLNQFVEDKKLASKNTTKLYMLDEQLQDVIKSLEPQDEDQDIAGLEENYLQQRHTLITKELQLRQELSAIFSSASSEIRGIGRDAANLLVENCDMEQVETKLSEYMQQVEDITEQCQQSAKVIVEEGLKDIVHRLDDEERSSFTQELTASLTDRFDTLPEHVKKLLEGAGPGLKKVGDAIYNKAVNPNPGLKLNLANYSSSSVHNMILKIGHKVGYKFKPWQAVKLSKDVAIGGQVLGILGVGVSVFAQIKSEQDEDKVRVELKKSRENIRSKFYNAADGLEDYGRKYIQDEVENPLSDPIKEIDEAIDRIRSNRTNRNKAIRELEDIQKECRNLIRDIHGTSKTEL